MWRWCMHECMKAMDPIKWSCAFLRDTKGLLTACIGVGSPQCYWMDRTGTTSKLFRLFKHSLFAHERCSQGMSATKKVRFVHALNFIKESLVELLMIKHTSERDRPAILRLKSHDTYKHPELSNNFPWHGKLLDVSQDVTQNSCQGLVQSWPVTPVRQQF